MAETESYFKKEKFVLRICGISFRENESIFYKIVTTVVLFNVCLYPFIAAADLFKHDFEETADLLTYEFPMFVAVIKAVTVLLNRKRIGKLLKTVDANLSLTNFGMENGDEEELMKKCLLITNVQTLAYWMCTFVTYWMTIAYSLSTRIRSSDYRDWRFPYGTYTVLNITYSPNFEISWAYQTWNAAFIAMLFTTIDVLMAAVLCHICYRLKILQSTLRKMVENTSMETDKIHTSSTSTLMERDNHNHVETVNKEWKILNASVISVVEYHLAILNVTKQADESFSVLLLLVFLGTLGVLAFMVYKISLIPLTEPRMLRSIGEVTVVISQVLMVCFWSEEMGFEGRQVGAAAYEASFVGTDLRFQKSLILIIRRSQMPIKLTAGFVEIALATFTWILRSTYSSYMVLRNQNLRDN